MCIDMCTDICIGMCLDLCIDMCIKICIDMAPDQALAALGQAGGDVDAALNRLYQSLVCPARGSNTEAWARSDGLARDDEVAVMRDEVFCVFIGMSLLQGVLHTYCTLHIACYLHHVACMLHVARCMSHVGLRAGADGARGNLRRRLHSR